MVDMGLDDNPIEKTRVQIEAMDFTKEAREDYAMFSFDEESK